MVPKRRAGWIPAVGELSVRGESLGRPRVDRPEVRMLA